MVTRATNYWIEVENSIISTVATLLVVQMKMNVRPTSWLEAEGRKTQHSELICDGWRDYHLISVSPLRR